MSISKFVTKLLNNRPTNLLPSKSLWAYVAIAFNRVDEERLKLVGPNRLCAEWVLKNGGGISLTLFPGKILRDYNALPPENIKLQIKEIDGTNSSIMAIGFDHLRNCKYIDKIILDECKHLENDGLSKLEYIKDSLNYLQISGCPNIDDSGLLTLKELTNLKTLVIFNMQYVENINKIMGELKQYLPSCKIILESNDKIGAEKP